MEFFFAAGKFQTIYSKGHETHSNKQTNIYFHEKAHSCVYNGTNSEKQAGATRKCNTRHTYLIIYFYNYTILFKNPYYKKMRGVNTHTHGCTDHKNTKRTTQARFLIYVLDARRRNLSKSFPQKKAVILFSVD